MMGTTSYYHFDGLGSTACLTDAAGSVTDRYEYTAYGEQLSATGSTPNPFRYVGQLGYYRDDATGDFYVRARNYQPKAARWISEDPLGFEGSRWNLYRYVFNNPMISDDPSGLWELRCRRMGVVGFLFKHCWVECGGHSYSLLNKRSTATKVIDDPDDKGQGAAEASGPDNCECIANNFFWNRNPYPYDKDDCNSNYFANQLLRSCGIQQDRPLGAYGWD